MSQSPRELLDTMLGYLGFVCEIEESQGPGPLIRLQLHTAEADRLIGRHGEMLEDLQFLLNRMLQARDQHAPRVQLDVEHFRAMREDHLLGRVRHLAESVRATGRPVTLEPMNSYQRHLVHEAFKADPDLTTTSPPDDARVKRVTLKRRAPQT